jgi:hypothetical protein
VKHKEATFPNVFQSRQQGHDEEGLLRRQDAGTADSLDLLLGHAGEEPEKAHELN